MSLNRYKVVVKPSVKYDLNEICEYYETLDIEGLSERFIDKINETIDLLSLFPKFEVKYDDIRLIKVLKFPFYIHFQVNEIQKTVFILAVTHTSKDFKM
jgi:plasmid stabilization system protein ParE